MSSWGAATPGFPDGGQVARAPARAGECAPAPPLNCVDVRASRHRCSVNPTPFSVLVTAPFFPPCPHRVRLGRERTWGAGRFCHRDMRDLKRYIRQSSPHTDHGQMAPDRVLFPLLLLLRRCHVGYSPALITPKVGRPHPTPGLINQDPACGRTSCCQGHV